MAAKKIFKLSNIEKGELLSWIATTQASWGVQMKLYDNQKVYFDGQRSSTEIEPPLSQGSSDYNGEGLCLEVIIPDASDSQEIKAIISTPTYMDDEGRIIGHGFICCGEAGSDNDYNDFYLSIIGWKYKK